MFKATAQWLRVARDRHCPICNRRDWCLIAADGSAAICARIEVGANKRCGEAGWLHLLAHRPNPLSSHVAVGEPRRRSRQELAVLAKNYQTAVTPARLAALGRSLALSDGSLNRLGVGWAFDYGAWSFPMTDHAHNVVGIRLRSISGAKFAVSGGREGLFVPCDFACTDDLFIAEGPTDTAALLDLGFAAVGRPSCKGGVRLLTLLVKSQPPFKITIVADRDEPGQHGAVALASRLALQCQHVRVLTPPDGVKDVREWKIRGATAEELMDAAKAAPVHRLSMQNKFFSKRGIYVR
jgi:hypothetical protein